MNIKQSYVKILLFIQPKTIKVTLGIKENKSTHPPKSW
jgi:hypothetical protein